MEGELHVSCVKGGRWRKHGGISEREKPEQFRPGVYKHYKGGLYVAIMLVAHHETRREMVAYVSLEHGSINVRPFASNIDDPVDPDAWNDWVIYEGERVRRFTYVGPASE